ncbi:MAG: EF-P beta-lysylation protein EpmB [Pseudomonadota bacterium]
MSLQPARAPRDPRPNAQRPAWKAALADTVQDVAELCALLALTPTDSARLEQICRGFPLRVPRGFVERMRTGDPDDPLLRQVLPDLAEAVVTPGYTADPLGETAATAVPGVLHKYANRALVAVTGSCAVHCRYCFRRHFDYDAHRLGPTAWGAVLDYLARQPAVNEVIFSGGDPLNATDAALSAKVRDLESLDHITRLRVHTRQPVVLPERVDAQLLDWVSTTRFDTVFVVHANHANELDDRVESALLALRDAGATLLNQSVLLAGVNDNAEALVALSERLFACGALPYYLHLPDRVQGTAHFHVTDARARSLHQVMQARLPGYLVPRLAREVAGEPNKRQL